MERGLYIAASGMLAEQVRQDQIANDLANASTPSYKPDRAAQSVCGALLLQNRQTGAHGWPAVSGRPHRRAAHGPDAGPAAADRQPTGLASTARLLPPDARRRLLHPQRPARAGSAGRLVTPQASCSWDHGKPIGRRADGISIAQDGTVRSATKGQPDRHRVSHQLVQQGDNVFPAPRRGRPRRRTLVTAYLEAARRPGDGGLIVTCAPTRRPSACFTQSTTRSAGRSTRLARRPAKSRRGPGR